MVAGGSVLGEGAFFSRLPRSATVQASSPCTVWSLTAMRFRELSNRNSPIALELTMAVGSVLAKRLYNRPKRVAVT
jgi:CRP-like cAMP-binding protein